MKTKSFLELLLISLFMVAGPAYCQKSDFKNAVKKNIRSFDGHYYVDLSKKYYSPEEVKTFAAKNGYKIFKIHTGQVSVYGAPRDAVRYVTMLPNGASLDIATGHANPADEPYKTIKEAMARAVRKGEKKSGTYIADYDGMNINTDMLENIREIARSQRYFFLQYISKVDWASGRVGSAPRIITSVYFIPEDMLPTWVLTSSFKDITGSTAKMKTGKVRIDPEKKEWIDGILWSGDVVDGMLSGSGHGVKIIDENWTSFELTVFVVDGTFDKGVPIGELKYRYGKSDRNGELSLYGQYNVFDDAHEKAGISITLTPQPDVGISLMEWARITVDIRGKRDRHNNRYGYVDNNFNLLCWLPGNIEGIQPMQNGKAYFKHRTHGKDNSNGAVFYSKTELRGYYITKDGKIYMDDNERTKVFSQYDALMANWDELHKPYNGFKGHWEHSDLWRKMSEWDKNLDQFDLGIMTVAPLDEVKASRSNYNNYAIFRQLVRLNELVYSNAYNIDRDYSFIYDNPGWASNRRNEGERIMQSLRENSAFNPPYKDSVFSEYSKEFAQYENSYSSLYSRAVDWHRERKRKYATVASSYSSSSSSSTSKSNENVNVEELSLSDFDYEIDEEWSQSLLAQLEGSKRKDITMTDKDGNEYKSRIETTAKNSKYFYVGHNAYESMTDAIIAAYALEKYGKIRKKGRKTNFWD